MNQVKEVTLLKIRKPNRVTTPRRAVLNGTRTSHASMPRARGRWRPDGTRSRAGVPGLPRKEPDHGCS
jgi:hypothetical protein